MIEANRYEHLVGVPPGTPLPASNAVDGELHRHQWYWAVIGMGWKARVLTPADGSSLGRAADRRHRRLREALPTQGRGVVAVPRGVEFAEAPDAPRTHITLRIIAQDPSVKGDDGKVLTATVKIPWSRMEDGPRGARFHVVDFDAATGRYLKHPGLPNNDAFADAADVVLESDYGFHAQQVYAAASRTLATFESALGRRLSWAFNGHHLHLVPHAFAEANAYYSCEDRALLFGYVPAIEGRPTYTCLSYDVVVHETTHAVLDGLRSRFLEPGLPDQAGFHEGFADIVALLSVFSMRPVVEQCLGKADKAGRIKRRQVESAQLRRGVLAGVAEQIGQVLTQGRGALRRSAMNPPPADWSDLPQFQEPHRRGEVLVAVVLDLLIDIWVKRLEPLVAPGQATVATLDRVRAAEEGAKAASQLLTMLIRGPGLPATGGVRVRRPARRRAPRRRRGGPRRRPRLPGDPRRPVRAGRHPPDAEQRDRRARCRASRRTTWASTSRPSGTIVTRSSGSCGRTRSGSAWPPSTPRSSSPSAQPAHRARRPDRGRDRRHLRADARPQRGGARGDRRAGHPRRPGPRDTSAALRWRHPGLRPVRTAQAAHPQGPRRLAASDRRVEYLHRAGRSDRSRRLGFSDGAGRGQAFAELHNTELDSGEAW